MHEPISTPRAEKAAEPAAQPSCLLRQQARWLPADMDTPIPMERVTRLWSGWSATTMNHIARFIGYRIPKDTWFAMPVGSEEFAVTYWCGHAIVHAR